MKEFNNLSDAITWSKCYLHCSYFECILINVEKNNIIFKGKKNIAHRLMSSHKGKYCLVTEEDINFLQNDSPYEYGMCMN